jgi:hypothetical protein
VGTVENGLECEAKHSHLFRVEGKHWAELYLHFAICLHDVYRDSFVSSTGYTILNRQDGEWGNVAYCKILNP